MKYNRKEKMMVGLADIELLTLFGQLTPLTPRLQAELKRQIELQNAVDAERLNEEPVPFIEMPIKAKPYKHQIRGFNMAMLVDLMVEEEVTNVTKDGYSYTLALKTYYSKKSEAELAAAGIDFFDVLRSEGMGDLIKETVNTRTLQSACANIVEEQEELPEALAECINSYEAYDITKRKSRKSA